MNADLPVTPTFVMFRELETVAKLRVGLGLAAVAHPMKSW